MKIKRNKIFMSVLATLLVAVLAFYLTRPKEPTYEGKTLTEWLSEYRTEWERHTRFYGSQWGILPGNYYYSADYYSGKMTNCMNAVKAIGTNAIPTLLKYMKAKELPGAGQVRVVLFRLGWTSSLSSSADNKHSLAHHGFAILGEDARSATPELLRMLQSDTTDDKTGIPAILVYLKPPKDEALPVMIGLLNHSNRWVRRQVAHALCNLYPEELDQSQEFPSRPVAKPPFSMDPPWAK